MFRFLKGLVSSMSLERKCLLFFGSALLILMFCAFLVIETLGRRLVEDTTRTRARDLATLHLVGLHGDAIWSSGQTDAAVQQKRQVIEGLRGELLDDRRESSLSFEVLGLGDPVSYENLPPTPAVTDANVQAKLASLESRYRVRLANRIAETRPNLARPLDLGEDGPLAQFGPSLSEPLYAELAPVNSTYTYFTPIFFKPQCMQCHAPGGTFSLDPDGDPSELAGQYPFRVTQVTMPYQQTHAQTDTIRAIVVALGIFIAAVTLFVLHAIVRHLVLDPMSHLREVSDAITQGDNRMRAVIETEDEFRELADAFNRMLRVLTETQSQITAKNLELDRHNDELGQLNLQLYEANRLKSDFLANMSHELRTPLNSIIGFSEVLQGIHALTEKQRRYASNIQKSGRLLLEMINDILDLAKVEAGKMEVRRTEFDLKPLISAQCDMLGSLIEDKNLSLSVDIDDDLPAVYQDPNKFGQILNNLLSNAIKFTPEGGMITIGVTDAGGGRFRLEVADTGVGIADEDQPVIFEKFRQSKKQLEDEGLTRQYAGTGLGLSIVKELARLLGGEISFESELGRGTKFWVTLPWRLREVTPAHLPSPPTIAAAG